MFLTLRIRTRHRTPSNSHVDIRLWPKSDRRLDTKGLVGGGIHLEMLGHGADHQKGLHLREVVADAHSSSSAKGEVGEAGQSVFQSVEPALNRVLVEQLPTIGQLDVMRDWTERACTVIEAALEARRDEVEVENLEMAAFLIVTAGHGIMHSTLLDRPRLLDSDELREHTARLVLRYLGVKAADGDRPGQG